MTDYKQQQQQQQQQPPIQQQQLQKFPPSLVKIRIQQKLGDWELELTKKMSKATLKDFGAENENGSCMRSAICRNPQTEET